MERRIGRGLGPNSEKRARYENKIVSANALPIIRKEYAGQKIVLGSGCFDILHEGHVDFLLDAYEQGDVLVIGVNSDTSVKELKGTDKPVFGENSRAKMIAAFGMVDYVFVFDELDITKYIQLLQPDVFATSTKSVTPNKPEIVLAQSLGISVFVSEVTR